MRFRYYVGEGVLSRSLLEVVTQTPQVRSDANIDDLTLSAFGDDDAEVEARLEA